MEAKWRLNGPLFDGRLDLPEFVSTLSQCGEAGTQAFLLSTGGVALVSVS